MAIRPVEMNLKTIQLEYGGVIAIPVPVATESVTVLHKRVGDADAHAVTSVEIIGTSNTITRKAYASDDDQTIVDKTYTAVVDKVVHWTVSSTDAAVPGVGRARIVCRDGSGSVIRSETFKAIVRGTDDFTNIAQSEAEAWAREVKSAEIEIAQSDLDWMEV